MTTESSVLDKFCVIAHDARNRAVMEANGLWSDNPTERIDLDTIPWHRQTDEAKDQDRAAIGAVLEAFPALGMLRHLAGAYERLLQVHERVNMDTDEDCELHGRVVATFRKVLDDLERAMNTCGLPQLTTPRTLPDNERLVDTLEREWLASAADKVERTPREHCEILAAAVRRASGF